MRPTRGSSVFYRRIPLSGGRAYALVSPSDYDRLMQSKWHATSRGYAARTVYGDDGRKTTTWMHREIMGAPADRQVDHVNGDTLDNRRENLRICTARQNQANKRPSRYATSTYKGVSKIRTSRRNPWKADITIHGKSHYIGIFPTEVEAARAYDAVARTVHGDFARLNFPVEQEASSCVA